VRSDFLAGLPGVDLSALALKLTDEVDARAAVLAWLILAIVLLDVAELACPGRITDTKHFTIRTSQGARATILARVRSALVDSCLTVDTSVSRVTFACITIHKIMT